MLGSVRVYVHEATAVFNKAAFCSIVGAVANSGDDRVSGHARPAHFYAAATLLPARLRLSYIVGLI
jgi:hypothetical protein